MTQMFRTLSIGYLYCEHRLATQDYTTLFGTNINCHQMMKIMKDVLFIFCLFYGTLKYYSICVA